MKKFMPYLIVSLFFIMFSFVSCSNFNTDDNQAQILIKLPGNSKSASSQNDIETYKLQYITIPEKFNKVVDSIIKNNDFDPSDPIVAEYIKYQETITEKDIIIKTFNKGETIKENVNPGFMYLDLTAFDKNDTPLYRSQQELIKISAGQKVSVTLKLHEVYKFDQLSIYDNHYFASNGWKVTDRAIVPMGTLTYYGSDFFVYEEIIFPDGVTCNEVSNPNNISEEMKSLLKNRILSSENYGAGHDSIESYIPLDYYDLNEGSFMLAQTSSTNINLHIYAQIPYIEGNYVRIYTKVPFDFESVPYDLTFSDGSTIRGYAFEIYRPH